MIDHGHSTPKAEIDDRIDQLQQRLVAAGIDGALILQNTDLFYFAGTIQQSHLYIPAHGRPLLMVRKSLERARAESPLSTIVALNSPRELMPLIQDSGLKPPAVMGMELDVLPANNYLYYRKLFPGLDIRDVSTAIRLVRAVKSDYELNLIRQAAAFSDQVAEAIAHPLEGGNDGNRVGRYGGGPGPSGWATRASFACGCGVRRCFMVISWPARPLP